METAGQPAPPAPPAPPPPPPAPIRRLDEAVVNRIAAGEIIQRPASALKEMLENSLDAGATQIIVTVKDGGKSLLQIQDNGHGVRKDDLPILCERHTTSKLCEFEDLEGLQTLGFRGEALASISYVARLTVTTMTAGQVHGWRVSYSDGVMDAAGPKPAAANQGTLISVEDLFFNVPLRKKALKGAGEEYSQILDVMGRYAVYKAGVSMTCRRQGEARSDLHTLAGASRLDTIRAVFGAAVSKNVLRLAVVRGSGAAGGYEGIHCEVEGYISSVDYSGKKTQLVLFINGRSVECKPLKRALETTYAAVVPKAAKPFIFLEVRLPGKHVDVNVHPTKTEVGFLHQEDLIEAIRGAVEEKLLSSNAKRTYAQTQTLLPGAPPVDEAGKELAPSYRRPEKLVRTDAKAQTLHAFLNKGATQKQTTTQLFAEGAVERESVQQPTAGPPAATAAAGMAVAAAPATVPRRRVGMAAGMAEGAGTFDFMPTPLEMAGGGRAKELPVPTQQQMRFVPPVRQQRNMGIDSELTSVQSLLAETETRPHGALQEILRSSAFVGMADATLALVQHGTRLYLLDMQRLSADMFYQQVLRHFGSVRRIRLQPPLPVEALVLAALEAHEVLGRWRDSPETGTKIEVAALLLQLLRQKASMLDEYFGIQVDTDGCLASLPQLVEQYVPDLDRLPAFVLALGQAVDWTDEEACFRGLAQALAELYCVQPSLSDGVTCNGGNTGKDTQQASCASTASQRRQQHDWTAQHVIFPALRLFLAIPRPRASDGAVVELTRLEALYRVFERC